MRKNFKIRTLIKQLFTKYQFLMKLPQISHIHKNHNFVSIIGTFLDQPLLSYKFHGSDMWGMYFFIFAICEPLIGKNCIWSMISTLLKFFKGSKKQIETKTKTNKTNEQK